jgi:hypothetical protein
MDPKVFRQRLVAQFRLYETAGDRPLHPNWHYAEKHEVYVWKDAVGLGLTRFYQRNQAELGSERLKQFLDWAAEQAKVRQQVAEEPATAGTSECSVCMDAPAEVALVPCYHMVFCTSCIVEFMERGSGKCPLCRSPYDRCQRIYLA